MKIIESWLREWVNPNKTLHEICEQLTMAGLEVEEVQSLKSQMHDVVIGKVVNVVEHPAASRLHVCLVDVGLAEPLQIICAADNVRSQLKVAVALVNSVLPDGTRIKKAKLRGLESHGMICSASELQLAESSEGILELPSDAPIGVDIIEYLSLEDNIVTMNITPNRGDCLSIAGIAREVAALNDCAFTPPAWTSIDILGGRTENVALVAKQACPHYLAQIIKNIEPKIPTPIWLQERLRRSGIRPITLIVDIANYVMLEIGQPLHAFDMAKIAGDVTIRFACEGEQITLLDGDLLQLKTEDLVIADEQKILALAGIMGGKAAEIDGDTRDIFLESAYFSAPIISASARRHGLHTEASHRFERTIDANLQRQACERFTFLLHEITSGQILVSQPLELRFSDFLPKRETIYLPADKIKRILGFDLSADLVVNILQRLEMQITSAESGWLVTAPSFRSDIKLDVDLLEEIARIYGYDKIKELELVLPLSKPETTTFIFAREKLSDLLVALGYREAITYSFIAPKLQAHFSSQENALALANPLSADMSVMRTSLWPGLIQAMIYNRHRQQDRMRFFEIGLRFISQNSSSLQQIPTLAGVVAGSVYPQQWAAPKRYIDYFDIKNDIEKMFQLFGRKRIQFKHELHPALHSGVCARIYLTPVHPIGFIGKLHPRLSKILEIDEDVFLFEFDLSFLATEFALKFKNISKFPFITRDIALLINEEITWSAIKERIGKVGGKILQMVELFDVYRGEEIAKGQKSIALHLVFQDSDRTLTENEAEASKNQIVKVLEKDFNAKLRG